MGLTLIGLPTTSSATCKYEAGTFSKPSGVATPGTWSQTYIQPVSGDTQTRQTRRMEKDEIKLGDLTYSWDFGDTTSSGQHTFTGLTAGQSKTLSATVTVKCKKIKVHWTRTDVRTRTAGKPGTPAQGDKPAVPATPPGEWSSWDEGEPSHGLNQDAGTVNAVPASRTHTLTVIAKPANFSWGNGVATDKTIQSSSGLSATKWNELVTRVEQRINWKNQRITANYSSAEASSGELITASKYNIIAGALQISTVNGGRNGTLITAALFTALQTAVNAD